MEIVISFSTPLPKLLLLSMFTTEFNNPVLKFDSSISALDIVEVVIVAPGADGVIPFGLTISTCFVHA